ncbi:MAG: hypothetical protein LBE81_13240 [Azonexus sp.]|nr:hypothetical protein [Azonexus sp.]
MINSRKLTGVFNPTCLLFKQGDVGVITMKQLGKRVQMLKVELAVTKAMQTTQDEITATISEYLAGTRGTKGIKSSGKPG